VNDLDLIPEHELARMLNRHPKTLQRWRKNGEGPPYVTIGARTIFYRRESLYEFLSETEKGRHLHGRATAWRVP
jgi:hypothetical protein